MSEIVRLDPELLKTFVHGKVPDTFNGVIYRMTLLAFTRELINVYPGDMMHREMLEEIGNKRVEDVIGAGKLQMRDIPPNEVFLLPGGSSLIGYTPRLDIVLEVLNTMMMNIGDGRSIEAKQR